MAEARGALPDGLSVHVVRPERGVDVAFDVAADEVAAIVGPSGAGKTTVLRAIAGLDGPHGGHVSLHGEVWDADGRALLGVAERRVGLVQADPLLLPHLDLATNIALAIDAGAAGEQAMAEADELLAAVGLGHKRRRRPAELSTGEAQRVSLARALSSRPRLLLLDEPLTNLDVATRVDMRRLLAHTVERFPGPVLLVSHDPVDAYALARRIVVIEDGSVTHDGDVTTVVRRPRTRWAATLAGVNMFRGEVSAGQLRVAGSDQVLRVVTDVEGRAIATVPPRSIVLHRARPTGSARNVWHGGIASVEVHEGRVRVAVAGSLPVVAEVTPESVAALDLGDGGGVWVSIKATELEVYPS